MMRMAIYDNKAPPGSNRVLPVAYKCRLAFDHSQKMTKYVNGAEPGNLQKTQERCHDDLYKQYLRVLNEKGHDLANEWLSRTVEEKCERERTRRQAETALGTMYESATKKLIGTVCYTATSGTSLSHVENPYYRVVGGIRKSRRSLSRMTMCVAEAVRKRLRRRWSSQPFVSATFDDWTNTRGEHMLGVTLHGLESDEESARLVSDLVAVTPVVGSRTGEKVAQWVNAVVDEYTSEDVLLAATVADGAANEQLAGQFINGEDALNSLTCFSHTLELVVKAGLDSIDPSLYRIHLLMLRIKRHTRLRERLAELMGDKELVESVFEELEDE